MPVIMTEESGDVAVVSTPKQLVDMTELVDVVFHEVAGRRSNEHSGEPEPFLIRAMYRQEENELGIRFQVTVGGYGGIYTADAEAIFALEKPAEIDPSTRQEFIERVAMMAVYPYLRAAIADIATRLSLRRPVLSLLRPGDLKLQEGSEEEPVDENPTENPPRRREHGTGDDST